MDLHHAAKLAVPPLAWALYRSLRLRFYTALSRNPLAAGELGGSLAGHLTAARAARDILKSPPIRMDRDTQNHVRWRVSLGEFWANAEADAEFVARIAQEINADLYRYRARPGDVVFDCGANLGFFTRHALDKGAATVVAFEPSPETAKCFRKNFATEIRAGRVVLLEKGVWSEPDRMFLVTEQTSNPASHSIGRPEPGRVGTEIEVTSLDQAFAELRLPKVDFIKMDVEGAEVRALEGAAGIIRRFRPDIGVGTEHTDDMLQNSMAVIEVIRSFESSYRYIATDVHPVEVSGGRVVAVPHALYFRAANRPE
jgi:FkbM family methyltransferase